MNKNKKHLNKYLQLRLVYSYARLNSLRLLKGSDVHHKFPHHMISLNRFALHFCPWSKFYENQLKDIDRLFEDIESSEHSKRS